MRIKILADATLPGLTQLFPPPFKLTRFVSEEDLVTHLGSHQVLLCRSTLRVTRDLLLGSAIRYVATASSGIDHIDSAYLTKDHIKLIDAKGSNARAVADYVLAVLAELRSHDNWHGRRAGVIGMGYVGTQVASRLAALGLEVMPFDPLRAMKDKGFMSCCMSQLLSCDLICVHADLHTDAPYPSENLINARFLQQLGPQTVIVNAARGKIVDEQALLNSATELTYCTDVYADEPNIDSRIIQRATICTPHIAGHSIEAKFGACASLSQQLHAQFKLPFSNVAKPAVTLPLKVESDWAKTILSIYNPTIETEKLKQAADKRVAFLTTRKAHNQRHEFNHYMADEHDPQMQALLGGEFARESAIKKE